MTTATPRDLFERLALVQRIVRETPTIQLAHDRIELYAKLENTNGLGTVKDRPAMWILKRAIERGDVVPGTTIVESSSGNFACALATFSTMLGLSFIPVIDPNVSPANEAYLRAHCRRVVKVEHRDDTGGFLETRLRTVQALLAEHPGAYWPNQYENADGAEAHYELTGAELCRAVPAADHVFIGVGSAGTIAGVSRRVKLEIPSAKIIAVDVEGSVIFGQPPRRRLIPGIGSAIKPGLLSRAVIDDVVIVSERATVAACDELLRVHNLFVGGSTGSVYAAIQAYFRRHPPGARPPRVVFLCCDRGAAYVTSVFNPEWVAANLPAPADNAARYEPASGAA
jgi:N-(2-amino-2-carboxyethyl)-L-glutamate synthase